MENGELGLRDPEKLLDMSEYVLHKLMLGWHWRGSCLLFSAAASLILRSTAHQGSVRGLDFNSIRRYLLLSSSVNGKVSTKMYVVVYSMLSELWDATTGKSLVRPFSGHTSLVYSVAFSSDDKFIVSGYYDKTIRVWDVKTGHNIMGPLHGHGDAIYSVLFTHDDKYTISGSYDGTIRIWPMEQTQHSLFTDQSEIDKDGWVKGGNGELLFWVPLRHRANLHRPGNTWIIGPYSTRLWKRELGGRLDQMFYSIIFLIPVIQSIVPISYVYALITKYILLLLSTYPPSLCCTVDTLMAFEYIYVLLVMTFSISTESVQCDILMRTTRIQTTYQYRYRAPHPMRACLRTRQSLVVWQSSQHACRCYWNGRNKVYNWRVRDMGSEPGVIEWAKLSIMSQIRCRKMSSLIAINHCCIV